jgi:hypothetical protein
MLLLLTQIVFLQRIHLFLPLRWRGLFGIKWAFLQLNTMICRKYSFQKRNEFWQGNNVPDVPASNTDGFFFWEIYVFLQLSWIGLFAGNRAYVHLETPKLQERFLQKRTQCSLSKNVLVCAASNMNRFFGEILVFLQLRWIGVFWANRHTTTLSNLLEEDFLSKLTQVSQGTMYYMLLQLTQMVNFWEIPVFLHLSWVGLLGTKWTILHLEIMIWRKYSFDTLTQHSQGNSAACAAASYIDGFLWRSMGIFSTQLNRPTWSKQSLSPRWKTKVAGSILVKNEFNSQRETMCYIILILAQMLFLLDMRVFLHLSWIGEFGRKEPFSTLKILMCRKYSFQKRTKFSQGENVLSTAGSTIDGFLWRVICAA